EQSTRSDTARRRSGWPGPEEYLVFTLTLPRLCLSTKIGGSMSERTVPIARRGQRGLVFLVILLRLVMLFSSMPAARAAYPDAGTISTSDPSNAWQGD